MKAIILAGGLGTRLSEETTVKPKPMVEIGGRPILWHIMNIYAAHGVKEFVVALGYKGEVIKDYFMNYHTLSNDLSIDLGAGRTSVLAAGGPTDWIVHLVDTGSLTQTGGRLRRLKEWVGDETFLFTYGDGVADVDIRELIAFHRAHGKLATLTCVRTPERFGRIQYEGHAITEFFGPPEASDGWINGGYFVLEPGVFDYLRGDDDIWERGPIEGLARDGQLVGYRHDRFWSCMDTLREKHMLEELWHQERAPWKVWN